MEISKYEKTIKEILEEDELNDYELRREGLEGMVSAIGKLNELYVKKRRGYGFNELDEVEYLTYIMFHLCEYCIGRELDFYDVVYEFLLHDEYYLKKVRKESEETPF